MITSREIDLAYARIKNVVNKTPLLFDVVLSERYGANIYLKREDLQTVRSYKIRGAYNRMACLSSTEREKGIVCASAGNHAQGVAYSCRILGIKGRIYMPSTTSKQKIKQVGMFGKNHVDIILMGDTFDEAFDAAISDCKSRQATFIHPFDDELVIAGQATVGLEILTQSSFPIDYIFVPVGGGGLISGIGSLFSEKSPETTIIGVEPQGAPSMQQSLEQNERVTLRDIEKFVDGAAVATVGALPFEIGKAVIDKMILVPEGKVCTTILQLYNEEAIVVEPAGALSIAALDSMADSIKGKNVVCIVSGGNNDITRTEEIKERSLLYEGQKHYFIVRFPQRAGALREFMNEVLGPDDDITYFEYTKKNNRENGPAMVGIETKSREDFNAMVKRMDDHKILYRLINDSPELFHLLV